MDGIHDLGGKQGYGPVEVTEADSPFPTEWEARAFGITKCVRTASDYSVDKFRYTREQLPPLEYLTTPYYEQWMRGTMAMLVGSGMVTAEELASGQSDGTRPTDVAAPQTGDEARAATRVGLRFDGPYEGTPRFSEGDLIRVATESCPGHTRVPQYLRGRVGRIVSFHGAHGVPDDNVKNIKTYEPLYTVSFQLSELFEEQAGSSDEVNAEIWERFLTHEV